MARTSAPWPTVAAIAAMAVTALAGCADDGGDASGCGPITREALDPAYLVHVLDEDTPVDYTSDPPTSGPHKPSPPDTGVVDRALSRPVQVGILERGDVLLQYDPALAPGDRRRLEALAGAHVVVAPNPSLPDPVVATAWLYKRTCRTVASADLEGFIDERVGKGPS